MSISRSLKISVVVLLALATMTGVAYAQSAKSASWLVSTTYQNVGTGPANITFAFYPEGNATPINFAVPTLAAGAGTSLYIGSVSGISTGFRGNAVVSSDQPLVATVVQFSNDTGFKMRLLSNGFQSSDASSQYLVATTLLNKFNRTTVFSIQNVESVAIKATVRFYNADNNGVLAATVTHNIPANSSKYIDISVSNTGLPSSTTVFNGSAIVSAVKVSDNTAANVVAAASEFYTNQPVAANFEGIPLSGAANTVYVPTGLCQRFGLDTFYAVQNASLTPGATATINVTYRNTDGSVKTTDGPYTIGPGQKKSVATCAPSSGAAMANFSGSAVIASTGAPIAVIGKAQNSQAAGTPATQYVFTAFLGKPAGTSKMALPFSAGPMMPLTMRPATWAGSSARSSPFRTFSPLPSK